MLYISTIKLSTGLAINKFTIFCQNVDEIGMKWLEFVVTEQVSNHRALI